MEVEKRFSRSLKESGEFFFTEKFLVSVKNTLPLSDN